MNTTVEESIAIVRAKRKRQLLLLVIFALLLLVVFVLSVAFGAHSLPVKEVFYTIFFAKDGTNRTIIMNVRVPRCLVCILVGISFSLAGATLQGIMNNPLASPSTIGINSGAGLMTTICLVLFPKISSLQTPAAFMGAVVTAFIIYAASWKSGGIRVDRMVLIGVAITFFSNAITNAILIFYPDRVSSTLGFTVGSLAAKSWSHFYSMLPYTVVGLLSCILLAGRMNVLTLGDEMAAGLGVNVELERAVFIILASLMAASAVSTVGMLGFVGLIVPHVSRKLIGSDYRVLYPATALLGATLVLFCDLLARVLFAPAEIPVGIVLSVIGAPFFLYLLRREDVKK